MIPINISDLIDGSIIESNRIEFKSDWNPEKILHTICAFANDLDNIGGGYIVIGIDDIQGSPVINEGLTPDKVASIEKDVFRLSNLIAPRYTPIFSPEVYKGKNIVAIWIPCGESRPYKCPTSISKKKSDNVERAYYVRRMSNTVRASREEEISLIMRSNSLSFDNLVNESATVNSLKRNLVETFLSKINSDMDYATKSDLEIYKAMGIVRGPTESIRPLNIGILMFCDHPEQFIDKAQIEVVKMLDETGEGMIERTFVGPVNDQITGSLEYISSLCISRMILKVPDKAESIHIYSYPFKAIEESVVNAVYHKNYRMPEPVKVYIYPDRIEIFNRPGPDRSVSEERIRDCDLSCDFHRNSRLGDFLKELKLTEGRSTGIPRVLKSLRDNGSDDPVYMTDDERTYLRVIIRIHDAFLEHPIESKIYDDGKYKTPSRIKESIIESLRLKGCQTTNMLAGSIGYNAVNNTFRRCIKELMDAGEIEYLYPDNPRDRRQRLCLSRKR